MPGRDGTGPRGRGSKIDKGLGRDKSERKEPRFEEQESGGGFGQGCGLGIDRGRNIPVCPRDKH